MALIEDLGAGPVGLDTAVLIYLIEENQRFSSLIAPLFEAADAGELELVVSALTLLEVLVVPYRAGNIELAERYEAVLTRSRGVRMIDLTRHHMRLAAQLRTHTGIATPDALQLAACLASRCSTFVTNDRRLPAIPGLRIIQLRDYTVRAARPPPRAPVATGAVTEGAGRGERLALAPKAHLHGDVSGAVQRR